MTDTNEATDELEELVSANGEVDLSDLELDVEAFIEEVNLGELEDLEEVLGVNSGQILKQFETGDLSARTLRGVVWLAVRRENPEVTFDDARRVKLFALADSGEDDDDEGDAAVPQ